MPVGARSAPSWRSSDARVLKERGTAPENACLVHLNDQRVSILHPRDIDEAERTLAETRAAMEGGANHITELCDAA